MKYLAALLSISLVGCASSRAAFIAKTYAPEKSGRIRLHWSVTGSEEESKAKADLLMSEFCGAASPQITSEAIEATGVVKYSQSRSKYQSSGYAKAKTDPVISFVCKP